jgi:two-component system CheB/CheR fusion protein
VVFAAHDVLRDPSFTRIDLVSCRNLLIYLNPSAQQRVLRIFHYSLNSRGLLLLGSSEDATGPGEWFLPFDIHSKIYRRNDTVTPQPTLRWPHAQRARRDFAVGATGVTAKIDMADLLSRILAEHFAPPAVLVDDRGQIQQIHGRVGTYLELPAGRVNLNIVEMAREGLRIPLSLALREAIAMEGRPVERSAQIQIGGDRITLRLKAFRIDEPRLAARLYVVSFDAEKRKSRQRAHKGKTTADERRSERGKDLEQEIRNTRRDLQGSIDELQTANEELAASNEEAQSANEELQSTNEELQTAKEETQSLNEELHTVNAELTQKLETFERATDDLVNLMNNIEVATIFLDCQLRVMRFTPQARNVAHLIDADIGRPLADLAIVVDYPELLSDAAAAIETLHALERQALASDGRWYLVRIRPYRTARNTVDGVVVTFVDITDAKRSERLEAARLLAEGIVDAVREPFLVLDAKLRVVRANHAFFRSFRIERPQVEGRLVGDLGDHQWITPALRERLEKVLQERVGFDDCEAEGEFPILGRRRLILSARPVSPENTTGAELILLGIQVVDELHTEASRFEVRQQ